MGLYALKDVKERLNILQGDHNALKEKHRKLSLNTKDLVDKFSSSEKVQKIAENKVTKAESLLKAANFTISADTDELRTRMEQEHNQRKKSFEAQIKDLYGTIKNNAKLFDNLQKKYDDTTADWAIAHNLSKKLQVELTEQRILSMETGATLRKEIEKIKIDKKELVEDITASRKSKGSNSKLMQEILDYEGKIVRDSRIIKQLESELEVNKKNMKDIVKKSSANGKAYRIYKQQVEDLEGKLALISDKATRLEKEAKRIVPESAQITILENRYGYLVGKVVSAKNRITSLNASTPYRPGAVERTLGDVLDDLKNV